MNELLAPVRKEHLISPADGNVAADVELDLAVTRQPRQDLVIVASSQPTSPPSAASEFCTGPASAPEGSDWPVWFGMRLAHAVSMIHNWTGVHSDSLQTLLHQEMLMLDASTPYGGQPVFETSRRQALITLATLPLTLGAPRGSPKSNASIECFLSHCGASLTACWRLLKGSDLDTVDRLLNCYLLQLETVDRPSTKALPLASHPKAIGSAKLLLCTATTSVHVNTTASRRSSTRPSPKMYPVTCQL